MEQLYAYRGRWPLGYHKEPVDGVNEDGRNRTAGDDPANSCGPGWVVVPVHHQRLIGYDRHDEQSLKMI